MHEKEKALELSFSFIPWRTPIKVTLPDRAGLGCRYCIALKGMTPQTAEIFVERDEWAAHVKEFHGRDFSEPSKKLEDVQPGQILEMRLSGGPWMRAEVFVCSENGRSLGMICRELVPSMVPLLWEDEIGYANIFTEELWELRLPNAGKN